MFEFIVLPIHHHTTLYLTDSVVVDPYEVNASISAPFATRARLLIANVAIHGIDVLSYEAPSKPPWKLYVNIFS